MNTPHSSGGHKAASHGADALVEVPLHAVAHARAGDKGNRLNVSLFPYDESLYDTLADQVTAKRVHQLFAHRGATEVRRYEVRSLAGFNFVIDDVLEGGVNGSLNLDGHGKTNSFLLLSITVKVPQRAVRGG